MLYANVSCSKDNINFELLQFYLIFEDKKTGDVAVNILRKILEKQTPVAIRKYVIESEQYFSNDYHNLLKEIFEAIYNADNIAEDKKGTWLLSVSEAMYRDAFVTDKEINWFSCCLQLISHNSA